MRFFFAADKRFPRARPPLLPSALAIWDIFTELFYLALTRKSNEIPVMGPAIEVEGLAGASVERWNYERLPRGNP